jgi:hypothetical protein
MKKSKRNKIKQNGKGREKKNEKKTAKIFPPGQTPP